MFSNKKVGYIHSVLQKEESLYHGRQSRHVFGCSAAKMARILRLFACCIVIVLHVLFMRLFLCCCQQLCVVFEVVDDDFQQY